MNNELSAQAAAAEVANSLVAGARGVGRRVKRQVSPATAVAYPGQTDDGPHFAEVYLTWFFGRGTVMWRARFLSEVAANAAAKEHAKFLDSVLPTHYWAENWSGRRYKERHEYGIEWVAGDANSRGADDLAPVWRVTLPGQEQN